MPIEIKRKQDCTGCEACTNICPKNCIEMKIDGAGFWYPVVNKDVCVECELCVRVCPVKKENDMLQVKNDVEVYAGWSLDESIRYESTSGGFFSELAQVILEDEGYVVGAAYNDKCEVGHIIISDVVELDKIRQSKYTQSLVGNIYKNIKGILKTEKKVLFCGTPCQVAGLKCFLGKEYNNLYTVDFICRGINSPKAYRCWLNELEKKYDSKATRVWFKYKINGWKKSPLCTRVDFENGKECVQFEEENSYMKGYLGPNLYIRPSCGECHFKGVYNRYSDLTLADFWGIEEALDDDKGTSLIMLNTEKGRTLFEKCSSKVYAEKRTIEEIFGGNACLEQSVKINPKSNKFLNELDNDSFSTLVEKYARISIKKRIINKIKRAVQKLNR